MEKNWYAPPEKRVSKQADIYALGVIFHNLLYGKNPAYDRNAALIIGVAEEAVPERVKQILRKLLAFKIANRYQDLEEFFQDWELLENSSRRHREAFEAEKKAYKPWYRKILDLFRK